MSQREKILERILSGAADSNILFREVCQLISSLGFEERIRGSHHIFVKRGIEEILNLQPRDGKAGMGSGLDLRQVGE